MTTVHMIANAHLDPVWLWPWAEGLDEALATFRSAADRCDEYPELIFSRGEAWLYEKLERYDPALFARITELIESGQWHIMSGQYLQPDMNAPLGESHLRQFERGLRYFDEKFGRSPRVAANVDSFGHPATFPDLTRDLGLIGYLIQRPKSFQKELPQYFRWQGPEGTMLPTFRMSAPYTSMTIPELTGAIELALSEKVEASAHTMCLFGVGNHGGGPTKAQIEWILERQDYADGVKLVFSTPEAFFEATKDELATLPLITGDLQNCFPGCYSVMHDIHQAQRHVELRAMQAERANALLTADDAVQARRKATLESAWDDLLFNAFHDIVAGTAVARAWPGVRSIYGRADASTEEVLVETTRIWARTTLGPQNEHRHIFINPLDTDFEGLLEIEPWLEDYSNWDGRWIADETGERVLHQMTQPEANIRSRVVVPVRIPAGEHRVYTVEATPEPTTTQPTDLWAGPFGMRNSEFDVRLDKGGIAAITWRGKDILGPQGLTLQLREDAQDCWGMYGPAHDDPVIARWDATHWVLEDQGPLRARCRLEGRIGTSRVLMVVTLDSGASRIGIDLTINMDERHRLIQMAVDWPEGERSHRDGGPCITGAAGVIEREAGSIQEHPFQEFSLARFTSHDAAMLTQDCYSVSHRVESSIFTLLRAPVMASAGNVPTVHFGRFNHTDQGEHTFRFDLAVGEELKEEYLRGQARMIATPPIHFDFYEGMDRPLPQGPVPSVPNSMVSRIEPTRARQSGVNRE